MLQELASRGPIEQQRHGHLRHRRPPVVVERVERAQFEEPLRAHRWEQRREVFADVLLGRVLDVRNIVWCTGFRPDFSWIQAPFELGEDGYPVQYRGAATSSPGLYFAGLPFLHSFASMLIVGAVRDADAHGPLMRHANEKYDLPLVRQGRRRGGAFLRRDLSGQ